MEETVLTILEELTGTDEVRNNLDLDLFGEGLLDSLGSVQLLVELEGQLGIQVPVSEFDREAWATPRKIIQQAEVFKNA
ncbi:D-alanine--poly(phosphoribitol) ligase subunit DltC [Enterococcus camelliae]|uniref:D-alanyl carrier protein n=1 Tax=Enterococcus camelliae TaxID=453959 RepID=A0ABW5TJW2_9ENTE